MTGTSIQIRDLKKYYPLYQKKGFSFLDLPDIIKNRLSKNDAVIKVLDGVNLDIQKGECFGVIGPNGTGKSTLLRLIAGIIPQDSGTIHITGKLIPLLSLGVGFSSELNAHDNVYQYGMILGFSKKEMNAMYEDIIAFAGLEKYQYMTLKNFSSGMRVKLAFSTAVRIDPDILVLDEVLSVGDMSFKEKSQQKILEFCRSGKTVVIVSHSMTTIADLCDRAIFLKDGKIRSIGDPDEVISAYVEAMHGNLTPRDLVFAHGQTMNREAKEYDLDRVHRIHRQISDLHLIPLIRRCYDSRVESSLYEYLTLKNLKKTSQLEEVLAGIGEGIPEDEFIVGYQGTAFLKELGEKKGSQTVASGLMKNLFNHGFICFGKDTRITFCSGDETESPVSGHLSIIVVKDGLRTIPVLIDTEKIVTIDDSSASQILGSVHCNDPLTATLILPPDLYSEKAIAALIEKKIRLLAPVPVQIIEEQRDLQDFLDGVVSPERMQVFVDKPLFAKKGRFVIQGHEIDGFGFFNPQLVLPEYTAFFKKLDRTNRMFEGTGQTASQNPEAVIKEIARKNSRYFSDIQKDGSLTIDYNFDTIRNRQKLIGTEFLYHSGDWGAMECYRNYEWWKRSTKAVSLYYQIVRSREPLDRGKALLALIDNAIWAGMI